MTRLPLHWATAALAYEHRREQLDNWVCDCHACTAVRDALDDAGILP
jgi:hypothetical protein